MAGFFIRSKASSKVGTLHYYQRFFKVVKEEQPDGNFLFFKKTEKQEILSSLVFELGQFLAAVRSTLEIRPLEQAQREELFVAKARGFLKEKMPKNEFEGTIKFQTPIEHNRQKYTVGAFGISKKDTGINVVQFITGSADRYFENSICRSSVIFEQIKKWPEVRGRFAYLDDQAAGYADRSLLKGHIMRVEQ